MFEICCSALLLESIALAFKSVPTYSDTYHASLLAGHLDEKTKARCNVIWRSGYALSYLQMLLWGSWLSLVRCIPTSSITPYYHYSGFLPSSRGFWSLRGLRIRVVGAATSWSSRRLPDALNATSLFGQGLLLNYDQHLPSHLPFHLPSSV